MKSLIYMYLIGLFCINCYKQKKKSIEIQTQKENEIECTENGCSGTYTGAEFINGNDIAHQFSNKMSQAVGNKLKELYHDNKYKKVDFSSIKMTTKGMGSGKVIYYLFIPFSSVESKCDGYTSFDHVGGWNHTPALNRRKKELESVTMEGHNLDISEIKKTQEGLQEYWIQWKNKKTQSDCE